MSSAHFGVSFSIFCVYFLSFQVTSQRNEQPSEVGVVGQKVTCCNGTIKTEEEKMGPSPPLVKPAARDSVRALKLAKGQLASTNKKIIY